MTPLIPRLSENFLFAVLLMLSSSVFARQQEDSREHLDKLIEVAESRLHEDPTEAAFSAKSAITIAEALVLPFEQAEGWRIFGNACFIRSEYKEALSGFENAYRLYLEAGDSLSAGSSLGSMGLVFKNLKKDTLALTYMNRAYQLIRSKGESDDLAWLYNNKGIVLKNMKLYDSAVFYYKKSLDMKLLSGDSVGLANAYTNIGIVKHYMKEVDSALLYMKKALAVERSLDMSEKITKSLNNIGQLLVAEKREKEAVKYLQEALARAKELDTPGQIRQSSRLLYEIYKAEGSYREALTHYEKFTEITIDLTKKRSEREIGKMESALEILRQEEQIKELEQEKALQAQQSSENRMLIIFLAVICLLILTLAIISIISHRKKYNLVKTILSAHVYELGTRIHQISAEGSTSLEISYEELNSKLVNPISRREYDVLEEIFSKKTNREIAESLNVSLNTIKTHIRNLYDKLGANNRQDIISIVLKKY